MPSLVTWDDHEVANDYADKWSKRFDDPELFLMRRAAAYQAFYEHMPVRPILSLPNGPIMRVYDRFAFGDLIEVSLIDGRQYRSRPACYAPPGKGDTHLETRMQALPERRDAGRTAMMGFGPGGVALCGARAFQGAMESDRAGRADGAVSRQPEWRLCLLDRQLGRLASGRPLRASAQTHRRHPSVAIRWSSAALPP